MIAHSTYNRLLGGSSQWGNWQTTAAWGRNAWDQPPTAPTTGHFHFTPGIPSARNAALVETGLRFKQMHTVFARWEWAEKDELFITADRRHQLVYDVSKLDLGYLIDFLRLSHLRVGAGVYGALHWVPDDLRFVYGETPSSVGFFFRLKIT